MTEGGTKRPSCNKDDDATGTLQVPNKLLQLCLRAHSIGQKNDKSEFRSGAFVKNSTICTCTNTYVFVDVRSTVCCWHTDILLVTELKWAFTEMWGPGRAPCLAAAPRTHPETIKVPADLGKTAIHPVLFVSTLTFEEWGRSPSRV
jgi:hypothetical protein